MTNKNEILEATKIELDKLLDQTKQSLKEVKRVAAAQAWKVLQLAVAISVQLLEKTAIGLSGPDKKTIALEAISKFYDNVFMIVDVPLIPNVLEPIMHKYIKAFMMALVGASIDATVTTFKQIGIFKDKEQQAQTMTVKKTKSIKSQRKRK